MSDRRPDGFVASEVAAMLDSADERARQPMAPDDLDELRARLRPPWMIGLDEAGARVRASVDRYAGEHGVPSPSDGQVTAVLGALADHEALLQAVRFSVPDEDRGDAATATSVGRWLHALRDRMREGTT